MSEVETRPVAEVEGEGEALEAVTNGAEDHVEEKVTAEDPTEEPADEQAEDHEGGDPEGGEESDEYDFEEEQQAPEGDDDQYEDEDYEEEGEPVVHQNGHKNSLTALLLGNPNGGADEGDEEDEEDDYEDEEDDYVEEEVTPITPTSKKRTIHDALEDASPVPEGKGAKKARA